jgi:SAM-dependent methyltransferase
MLDPKERFSSRVDNYIRFRPQYPTAVLDVLRKECGLAATWLVADIGSGPGNLARLFLENGNRVFGVEPNREMREAGERLLSGYPRFTSVAGTAEATLLESASVDLVVAGQAFHWFDRDRSKLEFRRILRAAPWVVLVWNDRRVASTPFLAAYEQILQRYGTDYATVQHRTVVSAGVLTAFYSASGFERATFPNTQLFDFEGLKGRLLSSSYAPEADQPGHAAMLDELSNTFETHQSNGTVAFEYDTTVFFGQI